MTVSSAGRTSPMVAPVPLVGWTNTGAQGAALEVVEQPAMAVISLPMAGRMGLPTMFMTPSTQVVVVAVTDGS